MGCTDCCYVVNRGFYSNQRPRILLGGWVDVIAARDGRSWLSTHPRSAVFYYCSEEGNLSDSHLSTACNGHIKYHCSVLLLLLCHISGFPSWSQQVRCWCCPDILSLFATPGDYGLCGAYMYHLDRSTLDNAYYHTSHRSLADERDCARFKTWAVCIPLYIKTVSRITIYP